jgi:hypothetical protein
MLFSQDQQVIPKFYRIDTGYQRYALFAYFVRQDVFYEIGAIIPAGFNGKVLSKEWYRAGPQEDTCVSIHSSPTGRQASCFGIR